MELGQSDVKTNEIFDDVIQSVSVNGGPDDWLRSPSSPTDNYNELVRLSEF